MTEEEETSQQGEEEDNNSGPAIPEVWKYAAEDRVGQIVKYFNAKEEEELLESFGELNPETGQSLMTWATLHQHFVLVEWLIKRGKREAFAFKNKTGLIIYDKWAEERKAKAERDKEAAEEAAAKAASGEEEEEPAEKPEEPEMHQTVLEGLEGEEGVDIYQVRTIGELGLYEGGRDAAGNKSGSGQCLYVNGDVYIGQYKNNKREGVGTYFWAKDSNVYIGNWHNDIRSELGRMIYSDGGRYYGSWAKDKKNGKGRYTYPNGDTYDGDWESDLKEGEGTYTFAADTSSYIGTFKNGDFISGKWVLPCGATYYGVFKKFKPVGKGLFVFGNKFKQDGEYKKGKWIPGRVINIKKEETPDLQIQFQGRNLYLRCTEEQAATVTVEQLVAVANFPPFEHWRKSIEAQTKIEVKDIRVRTIEIDRLTKEIHSIRLIIDAYDSENPGVKLVDDEVKLTVTPRVVFAIMLVLEGTDYVIAVKKACLPAGDLSSLQLPTGYKPVASQFRGMEITSIASVCQLDVTPQNMINLTELGLGSSKCLLLTSSANNTDSYSMWLFRQVVERDYFNSLSGRIASFNSQYLGFQLELIERSKMPPLVMDTYSMTTLLLLENLGARLPEQTLPARRPGTPPPPEPEPAPVYTEEELAALKAAYEADAARKKQKALEQANEEGEGEEDAG